MQLHEQTQRFILLLIFYLLGPILTLGIIGGIVVRKLPAQAQHWERTLSQQTGLHWKIQSVEYRSPGFVRLHDVEIMDETAQRAVFDAPQIDIRNVTDIPLEKIFTGILTDTKPESTGLTSIVENYFPALRSCESFWQITVPMSMLDLGESSDDSALLVQDMLRKVFVRFDTLSEKPVQLLLDQVIVRSEHSLARGEDQTDIFHSVQGNFYRTPTERRSDWSFQIRGISELDWEHRKRLSFTLCLRDIFEISFQTGRQPIPSDLAAVFYSAFRPFSGGTFQGRFSLSTRSGRAESQTVRMEEVIFRNVPLAELVGRYTSFNVTGTVVDLRFLHAAFGADNIHAEGSLHVLNGAVEHALFHRCVGNFQLTVHPAEILDLPIPMIPFTASSIHFRLHHGGIDFWADQMWRDCIMYFDGSSSIHQFFVFLPPHRRTVTYHEVMSLFAPDNAPVVPLTPVNQILLQHIPIQ